MKTQLLLLLSLFGFIGFLQLNSITQPAMVNSNQKLDSVYINFQPIVKSNNELTEKTEKLVIETYDTDKNPTTAMLYSYQDATNNIATDSLRISMQHYDYNNFTSAYNDFTSEFSHCLNGNLIYNTGFETPRLYYLFNLKSATEEIVNTTTNNWLPSYYGEQLSDLRYPNATNLITTKYSYNANFSINSAYKADGIIELNGLGYYAEVTFYNWNTTDGFTPDYKNIYYNTYDANNKLTESIIKRIDDIPSGVEVNHSKFTINYGTDLFQVIFSDWNDVTNDWDVTNKKEIVYSNGNPIATNYYYWDGEWIGSDGSSLSISHFFDNNKYTGFSSQNPYTIEYYNITYNTDDLISYETYSDTDENNYGEVYEREYYYSSDTGVDGISENTLNNIIVYPNPVKNSIHLNIQNEVEYQVYTIDGKVILNGSTNNTINTNTLSNGIYFLKLKNNTNFSTRKIVINRN